MRIIKRDGREKDFDFNRIKVAVKNSYLDVFGNEEQFIFDYAFLEPMIEKKIEGLGKEVVEIEEIQDIIIECLSKVCRQVSKTYSEYRETRTRERSINSNLYKNILGLVKLNNEEIAKENSNKDATVASTQRDLIAGEVSKEIAKNILIPIHMVKAHEEGAIHWHDMDYTLQDIANCCLVNLEDMFINGTVINGKLVETPKSFSTACTVATQIMTAVSSSQFGGQSITIKHLAPPLRVSYEKAYKKAMDRFNDETIAKEIATEKRAEVLRDGIQTIRYQLNTMNSTNGQMAV